MEGKRQIQPKNQSEPDVLIQFKTFPIIFERVGDMDGWTIGKLW